MSPHLVHAKKADECISLNVELYFILLNYLHSEAIFY